MKVYEVLATIVVEDSIGDETIANLCRENIEVAVMEDFCISNCMTHFELKETIDYPDGSRGDKDYEKMFDNWMKKSQEVIERIRKEKQGP